MTWIGLTLTEKRALIYEHLNSLEKLIEATEQKLRDKNTCSLCNQMHDHGHACQVKDEK